MKTVSYHVNPDPFPSPSGDTHLKIVAVVVISAFLLIAGGMWLAFSNAKRDAAATKTPETQIIEKQIPGSTNITVNTNEDRPGYIDLAREAGQVSNVNEVQGQKSGTNGTAGSGVIGTNKNAVSAPPSTSKTETKTSPANTQAGAPLANTNTTTSNSPNTNTSGAPMNTNQGSSPGSGSEGIPGQITPPPTDNENPALDPGTSSPQTEPICVNDANQVILLQHTNECQ